MLVGFRIVEFTVKGSHVLVCSVLQKMFSLTTLLPVDMQRCVTVLGLVAECFATESR